MKWNHVAKSLVLALAVMVATSAFAGSSSKGSLHLSDAAQVNGQAIPAGDYQLRWEGTGENVEVSVMQGKKVVTKTAAKLVEVKDKFDRDATVVDRGAATPTVTEVRFAGKKYAVEVKDKFDRDATVVDRGAATPTVTEVRFAGKKYALILSGAEKAAMGESTR